MSTDTETYPIGSWVEFDLAKTQHRGVVVAKDSHGIAVRWYANRRFRRVWLNWSVVAGRTVVSA